MMLRSAPGWRVLVAMALLTFIAYLPTLPNWMKVDEGFWSIMAYGPMLFDEPFYAINYENKPPGVFGLYAGVYALFGFGIWKVRLVFALLVLLTAVTMVVWLHRVGHKRAGVLAGITYPPFMALVVTPYAYTEPAMVLFTTFGMCLAWRGMTVERPARYWLGAGAALAVGALFKQIVVFDMLALALVALFAVSGRSARVRLAALGAAVGGAAVVAAATLSYLHLSGQLAEFWYCIYTMAFAPDVAGARSDILSNLRMWIPLAVLTLPLWIGAGLAWRRVWPHQEPAMGRLLAFWLPLGLLGASISRQFGPHYAVQFLPPLFLAGWPGAVWLGQQFARRFPQSKYMAAAVVALLLAGAVYAGLPRYHKILPRLTGEQVNQRVLLGTWLAERTATTDRIQMVGWTPQIYVHSQRQPASRYAWSFYITMPGVQDQILSDLRRHRPPYVIFAGLPRQVELDFAERVREQLEADSYRLLQLPEFPEAEVWALRKPPRGRRGGER